MPVSPQLHQPRGVGWVVMNRPHTAFCCLIAAQCLCLGVGLWMHDCFVVSSLSQQEKLDENAAAQTAAVREVLVPARWIVLVWIGGLQAAASYLVLSRAHAKSCEWQTRSIELSRQREKDLLRTRNAVIFGLAKLAESRDHDTGYHLEKIACYSTRLATELRRSSRYRGQVSAAFVRQIGISSALHDIGKVAVEDAVLLKPGQLTPEERDRMQSHAQAGGACIREIERRLGNSNFLGLAREIAFCHHERWDGQGYPVGLKGEEIPLAARIVAIADVYDALSSRRIYKSAFPHKKCVEIICKESGKQFDPHLVDVFLKIEGEFREIAEQFAEKLEESESLRAAECPDPQDAGKLTQAQEAVLQKLFEPDAEILEAVEVR